MTDEDINYAKLADTLREMSDTCGDHLWLAAAVVDQVDSLKSLIAYQREQITSRDRRISFAGADAIEALCKEMDATDKDGRRAVGAVASSWLRKRARLIRRGMYMGAHNAQK